MSSRLLRSWAICCFIESIAASMVAVVAFRVVVVARVRAAVVVVVVAVVAVLLFCCCCCWRALALSLSGPTHARLCGGGNGAK